MRKYFIFADVHGHFDILMKELKIKGFEFENDEHCIISLGDNFDRGNQNVEVFSFLKSMYDKNRAILICGNHEEIFKEILKNRSIEISDVINGTAFTAYQVASVLCGVEVNSRVFYYEFEKYVEKIINTSFYDLILKMIDYHETSKYIFTHGFIPVKEFKNKCYYLNEWRNCNQIEFDKAKWNDGQKINIEYGIFEPNKKIIIGHKPTLYYNYQRKNGIVIDENAVNHLSQEEIFSNSGIYETDKIIAIDAYTIKSKRINILVLSENEM